MSTRRLAAITTIPDAVKWAFRTAEPVVTGEEWLWRERAARMTLDALGHTNLTIKPLEHNEAVRYARRWFRQMYADHPDPECVDNALATFEYGGVLFESVRDAVLKERPILFDAVDGDEESS